MEQNISTIPLSVGQISNNVNLSFSINSLDGDDSQKSEAIKSTPYTDKEIIALPIEQNNKLSESSSNSNSFSENLTELKKLYSTCKFCRKKMENIYDFINHNKSHTDEQFFLNLPFKCTVCPLAFKSIINLKIHSKTHKNKKPYKCNVCSRHFHQTYSLEQHALAVHGMLNNN